MQEWSEKLRGQKARFVQRALERAQAMEELLQKLDDSPWDSENLKLLGDHFHQVAGTAGVYDLDSLTEVAESGEEMCQNIYNANAGIMPAHTTRLRQSLLLMVQILTAANEKIDPRTVDMSKATTEVDMALPPHAGEEALDVLVAGGESAKLEALTKSLQKRGLKVRPCFTATVASNAMKTQFPHALIVHVPLKEGSGYQLIKDLRAMPGGNKPPVVLLSEEQGFLDKVLAIRNGVDAMFEHPIDVEQVAEKLSFLLDRDKPERYRILSVEDDPDQAAYIMTTLEAAGYQVVWLPDPKQFEETLLAFCPDLLLLDVVMGDVSGFELARYVRQNERFAALPILFLTTQNQLRAHIESARAGGDDHLIKPVVPQLLVAAVAGRLERYRIFKKLLQSDGLTQCLNHSAFMEHALRITSTRHRHLSHALIIFDIDNLRGINDTHGFAVGDKVIVSLAQMVKTAFRNCEVIGRISGDEIGVIVENLPIRDVAEIASGVVKAFGVSHHLALGEQFKVTASAGVANLEEKMDLKAFISDAEKALKAAKKKGKNTLELSRTANAHV